MVTVVWLCYAAAFIIGLFLYVASSVEKTFERITLPQLFYVLYLMAIALFCVRALRDPWLAMVFMAPPAALAAWLTFIDPPSVHQSLREDCQKELESCRAALQADKDDILALEAAGDLYRKIGEASLARRYYERLTGIYSSKKEMARLKGLIQDKLNEIGINPQCAQDPKFPAIVRACPACESVTLRFSYACPCCRRPLFPSLAAWRAVMINRFFDAHNLTHITAAGVAFLPFLFVCGSLAYTALWAVWTLAFTVWRA